MKPGINTKYLGLDLKSPLVASASPLARNVDNLLRMEDAGIGAAVMFSLFEEQIRAELRHFQNMWEAGLELSPEAQSYFPEIETYPVGVASYLKLIRTASERCDMPIIGSLNGTTPEGWIEYAKEIEDAGASALELNIFYVPTDITRKSEVVEKRYIDVLKEVKSAIEIPVAVKLSPYFSSMGHMATQLSTAGADGLVLFNRFYEPDIDIDHLDLENSLELSTPAEARLPLMWIGILYDQLPLSLAATTGVHSGKDLIKYLLAGADVAMTTSALLKRGIEVVPGWLGELERWMELRGFHELSEMRGVMSRKHVKDPGAYARANYIKVLQGYEE